MSITVETLCCGLHGHMVFGVNITEMSAKCLFHRACVSKVSFFILLSKGSCLPSIVVTIT